jgi:hypothetical protein
MLRQNDEKRLPNGVLSGSMIIDMLEYISSTANLTGHSLVIWLQEHYISPLARIERLDGLIVTYAEDLYACTSPSNSRNKCCPHNYYSEYLHIAYERYIDLQGELARKEPLFVPGLEPVVFTPQYSMGFIPDPPRNTGMHKWRASDMYYKNGFEVKRKSQDEGYWKDTNNWDRWLWNVQGTKCE